MHHHTPNAWLHAGRIRHNLELIELDFKLGPPSKRTRYNFRKVQENVDIELKIKQESVELKCYVGFLWDCVESFAIDVSSLSCLSACSRWHHARLQGRLDDAKLMQNYLEKPYIHWSGAPRKPDRSSQVLRSIISIVPSPCPPKLLDPYVATIVGGWFNFFALPRRPITQAMRDRRDLTEPDSIRPHDVDAGLTFLEDEFGWALVFKFRLGDEEPCCYWLHSSNDEEFWGTGKQCNNGNDDWWFPSSKLRTSRQEGNSLSRTYGIPASQTLWLQTLALNGKATTLVARKPVQIVLCS